MVLRSEQETMQALIRDALTLLCRSNLQFQKCISMEALVGITLDENDIILVSVKETMKHTTPKKTPMQVALKSVQTAVQRVNAKAGGIKSSPKKSSPKGPKTQGPAVINIMPTNLPEIQDPPVAIGTIETEGTLDNQISFEFLNTKPKEEDVVVKEEKENEDGYGRMTEEILVPSPLNQAEGMPQGIEAPVATTSDTALQSPNFSPIKKRVRETSKRKIPMKDDGRQKVPRVFIPDGKPLVPLDLRYLGLSRNIADDQDFKRGKYLERLAEGEIKWDELNEHQQNCVFAKAAVRGREENEIVCSLCYLAFTKAQEYKKHIRSHFGQFSIPCNICEKEFWSLDDLETHMVTHVTFHCPLCNDCYPTKLALTTHIRNDHRIFCQDPLSNNEESPEAKEVVSPVAGKPDGKQIDPVNSGVNTAGVGKSKLARVSVKPQITPRKDSQKKDDGAKATGGKRNTMQVTVVPQLIRTGSADSKKDESDSEEESVSQPVVGKVSTPVTRSKGKLSKTKGAEKLIPSSEIKSPPSDDEQ